MEKESYKNIFIRLILDSLVQKQVFEKEVSGQDMVSQPVNKEYLLYFSKTRTVKWMDVQTLLEYKKEEELNFVSSLISRGNSRLK